MALRDDLMQDGGVDVLMGANGDLQAVSYTTPAGDTIECDAIIDSEKGGLNNNFDTGDVEKVIRLVVRIPVGQLVNKGVVGLERFATVTVDGKQWAIDLPVSEWGPPFAKLGLMRREITRHEEMESHGSVR